jgi:hypothetical protein
LYFVAQTAMAATFWAAWKLAKEFLKPWPALCAAALLEACSYYNFMSADLNNAIVLQPLWALATLGLYRAITTQRLRYWAVTGACLGLGMLTKYDMAVLVVAMLLLPAINSRARATLRTAGPYVTFLIAMLFFLPHVVWMFRHDFLTVRYAYLRAGHAHSWLSHLANPLEFLLAQILALWPILLMAWPLVRKRRENAGESSSIAPDRDDLAHARFQRDFLAVVCFGPLALDLTISLVTGLKPQSMWGAPMWTFVALVLLRYAGQKVNAAAYRSVAFRCGVVGCVFAVAMAGRNVVLPHWRAVPSRIHFPGVQLSEVVEREWRERSDWPLSVIAGPWWAAANAGLHLPGHVQVYDFFTPELSPWASDVELRREGGVILWEADAHPKLVDAVRRRFPDAVILPNLELAWQTSAAIRPAEFGLAIVLPESITSARTSDQAAR